VVARLRARHLLNVAARGSTRALSRHPRVQLSSAHQLEAMIDTPSQEPAAPGHLPGPRHATGGLAAKWKALLFMAGVLFLFPLALVPTNWLSARGLLQGRAAIHYHVPEVGHAL
jgi:hypothetical protein